MKNFRTICAVFALSSICCSLAVPVVEEIKILEISEKIMPQDTTLNSPANQTKEKLRQDGDGDGETPEVSEIESIGQQVATIISGTLGGNLNKILQGAGGFIEEEDTQSGVGNIFTSIGQPFNQLVVSGVAAGQKFFGITSPPAILLAPLSTTTPAPLPVAPVAPVGAVGGVTRYPAFAAESYPSQQYVQQRLKSTEAPKPLEPVVPKFTTDNDDDELETDGDAERKLKA